MWEDYNELSEDEEIIIVKYYATLSTDDHSMNVLSKTHQPFNMLHKKVRQNILGYCM
jgi:hypothetical protein